MKKFYWLLLFISLLTGCMNKTSTVLTKLENKTDRQLKLQKENLTLYCEDIDKILKIKKEDSLSTLLSETETIRKTRFEAKYTEYINNHNINEAIVYLKEPYFQSNLFIFRLNAKRVNDFVESFTTPPIEDKVINYKMSNLKFIFTRDTFITFESYDSPERREILTSNDLEWQKNKFQEIIDQIKNLEEYKKTQSN